MSGRHTVLTPEVHELIMQGLRIGATAADAALAAGISPRTLDDWEARGRRYLANQEHPNDRTPLDVQCPTCKAPIGAPCTTAKTATETDPHARRRSRAGEPFENDAPFARLVQAADRAVAEGKMRLLARVQEAIHPHDVRRIARQQKVLKDGGTPLLNADGTLRMVEEVTEHVDVNVFDGKLALELLARRFPDEFAATQRQRVEGAGGGPVEFEVREAPVQPVDAESVAAMERIMRRSPQLAVVLFNNDNEEDPT